MESLRIQFLTPFALGPYLGPPLGSPPVYLYLRRGEETDVSEKENSNTKDQQPVEAEAGPMPAV